MYEAIRQDPVSAPRDWDMLAAWLRAEWDDTRQELAADTEGVDASSYCAGLKEAYSAIGRIMKDCPSGEREARLYELLLETLGLVEETAG